jgi:hypothetical protein
MLILLPISLIVSDIHSHDYSVSFKDFSLLTGIQSLRLISSQVPISTSAAGIPNYVLIQSPAEPPVEKPSVSEAGPTMKLLGKSVSKSNYLKNLMVPGIMLSASLGISALIGVMN